jgi:hypothetical protein
MFRSTFYPIDHQNAFGFLDPGQVVWACHLIPKFALGKCQINGERLSEYANNGEDWQIYYANRYVITIMVMFVVGSRL